jgi:FMN phosphatase YigB (HAD superfamily)
MWRYELHKNAGTVNYEDWKEEKGILVPVFDIDNTLTLPYNLELDKMVLSGLKKQYLSDLYPGIAIATNNVNYDHAKHIGQQLEDELDIEVFIASVAMGIARKPNREQGDIIAEHFGVKPDQLGVVGDRRISDIRFARNLGAGAMALCMKIGEGDSIGVATARKLEQMLVWYEKKMGIAYEPPFEKAA